MTLQFEVKNQSLCVKQPLIVSDTINYIDAQFTFVTDDWKNLTSIWSHWKKGTTVYDVELSNGVAANLPLSTGEWEVYLHGSITQLNTVIYRVTTQIITIQVTNTGVLQGQPFAPTPTSAIEHLEARLDSLEESSVSATTLPVGSSATATKTVVDDHYNINFGIPKGDTGASGVEISNTQPTDPVVSVWINPSGTPSHGFVPSGGNAGQILAKASNTSYDVTWQNAPSSNDPRIGSLVANKFLKVSPNGQSIQMADAGGENHLYEHIIRIAQGTTIQIYFRLLMSENRTFTSISGLFGYLTGYHSMKAFPTSGWYRRSSVTYNPHAMFVYDNELGVCVLEGTTEYYRRFYPSESPNEFSVSDTVTQIF